MKPASTTKAWITSMLVISGLTITALLPVRGSGQSTGSSVSETFGDSDESLYRAACAACHGEDGSGKPPSQLGFDIPVPDLTDCSFASREPDPDWFAVIHDGGPVRGFDRMMPAFGELLNDEEIQRILDHVRTLCTDDSWPRGELNLPRPLITEKAFPEDEAVVTAIWNVDEEDALITKWLYEKRFGARSQIEIDVPVGYRDRPPPGTGSTFGIGDIGLGYKYALYHDLSRGAALSLGGEVVLPTGDEDDGFGKDTLIFEPYASFSKILFNDGFLHLQALAEFPEDSDKANKEYQLRSAFGWTFTERRFGRAWSPMIEVVGKLEDADVGTEKFVDIAPQFQVTLNTRQHVMFNVGVIIPVTNTSGRPVQISAYLLWDWFDGGLSEGW